MDSEEKLNFIRTNLELPQQEDIRLEPLGKRGSDRAYYRVTWGLEHSAILSQYQSSRMENTYFAGIAAFLSGIGIRIPKILGHDQDAGLLLQEDLGGIDLMSLRDAPWETRRNLYQKTLILAHALHSFPKQDFPAGLVPLMEPFSPSYYLWERDYFRTNFVTNLCGIGLDPRAEETLECELAQLAEGLMAHPESLIHRDLQAPNVMIRNGDPYLIDFQGMRFGNRFYDLGSLLCDPHACFTNEERMYLLRYYYSLSPLAVDWEQCVQLFWQASAQRLMQALGAYGFLGLARGLTGYFKQVPAGLHNLQFAAAQVPSLSHLLEISHRCEEALKRPGCRIGIFENS